MRKTHLSMALPMVTDCGHTSSAAQEAPWREASVTPDLALDQGIREIGPRCVEVPCSSYNLCFHDYRWLGNSDAPTAHGFCWGNMDTVIPLAPKSLHSPLENYSGSLKKSCTKGMVETL